MFQFLENGVLPADDKQARKVIMAKSNFEIIGNIITLA